jgi:hypothetical protein
MLKPLSEQKDAIQIAWNLHQEGDSLARILNDRAKIEREAEYLAGLGIPIFLRFAAEMNVWEKTPDAKKYIDAFRFVATIMKEKAPNVAMVWSVNSTSAAGLNYEMFYPGDEYVDWVGVSLYSSKYFRDDINQSDETQAIYLTGKYANPLKQLDPVIQQYGGKKPIMLSEVGVENFSLASRKDETEWAIPQMVLMYRFLPIVYPQVKAIFYFNTDGENDSRNRYTLWDNREIRDLYAELVSSPYFIKRGERNASVSYKKLENATVTMPANNVTLVTYSPYIGRPSLTQTYRIDGERIGEGNRRNGHGRQRFDLSNRADGSYTLTVTIADGNATLETRALHLRKRGNEVTVSNNPIR